MLMLSIGMSLSPRQLLANWRRLTTSLWTRLLAATFLLPPLLALTLGHLFSLGGAATAGLFLIAAVPGAPLMTRGAAKKGFGILIKRNRSQVPHQVMEKASTYRLLLNRMPYAQ